jgi:hypothetical protein
LAVAATAVVAQSSSGQQPAAAPATSLILGRTVDAITDAPIGGAAVTINPAGAPAGSLTPATTPTTLSRFPLRVISDANGHFVFHDLPKGSYTIQGSKPGYADAAYGRRSPTDTTFQSLVLGDDERRGDVTLSFWKAGALGGTVVDEAGEPVIGIQIRTLRRAIVSGRAKFNAIGSTTTTDDRGSYRVASLPPGEYLVGIVSTQTTVPASFQSAYTAAVTAGTSQDFQRELDRSAGLLSLGAIGGAGQRVGSWLLQTAIGFGGDRMMMAPPIDHGKIFVYPTTYYPGATGIAQASLVTLAAGDNRTGIDFQVRPVVASQISGTLTGPQGPESYTTLDLIPAGADDMQRDYDFAAASTKSDTTGAFVFLGVPTGNYVIRALKLPPRPVTPSSTGTVIQTGTSTIFSGGGPVAQPPIPDDPTWWASVPVAVGDRDVTGVAVALAPGARVSGALVFDGTAQAPTAAQLRLVSVQIDQADARTTSSNQFIQGRGVVDANGQFKTYQFGPGRYVIRASATLPGWTFKGATHEGRDVTDSPLELNGKDITDVVVTFTDRPTELGGSARDSKGPDPSASVIVFPRQPARWTDYGLTSRRVRSARVASDGTYRFVNLPADDYLVVSLAGALPPDWQDPKFLQKIAPLGTAVTLADGEKKSQDVQTRQIR